jgi:hypothetical protein
MVLYMISFFLLPKGLLGRLDYSYQDTFGKEILRRKKCRLTKWSVVCRPKGQGGLGVHDLEVKNRALLGKWLFKLLIIDRVCQTILIRMYVGSCALSEVVLETWRFVFLG